MCAVGDLGSGGDGSGSSASPFDGALCPVPLAAGMSGATCECRFSPASGAAACESAPTAASAAAASGSEPVRRCLGSRRHRGEPVTVEGSAIVARGSP